jgi:N-acetyl-D-muramate 6-phosphate phosphatase
MHRSLRLSRPVRAVLFDLDGTLIDSAPGLTAAANAMLAQHGKAALPHEKLRPHAGSGARGMLAAAFAKTPAHDDYEALREEFYSHYESRILHNTQVFDGVHAMFDALDQHGLPWGIVTNKALRFAEPTALALGLWPRAAALIAGDSTPFTKPHPEPLLEAARRMGQAPQDCVYIGDDARDVQAGRAAGMATLAASWGYLGLGSAVHGWGADAVLEHPNQLLTWLELP